MQTKYLCKNVLNFKYTRSLLPNGAHANAARVLFAFRKKTKHGGIVNRVIVKINSPKNETFPQNSTRGKL